MKGFPHQKKGVKKSAAETINRREGLKLEQKKVKRENG